MRELNELLSRNKQWAKNIRKDDPEFFSKLSRQQKPEYLWIGCSDSRVPATEIVDLLPGEIFVHRNIANLVIHTDLNCLSVIQYAIDVLKVKHIIVCGHYDCGGINAAMENREHGLIDNWLRHIRDTYRYHQNVVDSIGTDNGKNNLLCELNVIEQVGNICHTTIVQSAWKSGQEFSVHGWIYAIENGVLTDLNVTVSGIEGISRINRMNS